MKVFLSGKSHDFPKKIGDLHLAWYNQGKICISRKQCERQIQKQNIHISEVNQIVRKLWDEISPDAKRDMALYAKAYKNRQNLLRKRGVSAYGVILMIVHALIKRFSLKNHELETVLRVLITNLSIQKAVQLGLLIRVANIHQLNHEFVTNTASIRFYEKEDILNFIAVCKKNILNLSRMRC